MRAVGYHNLQQTNAAPDSSSTEDPIAAIKRYCVEEFHQLIAVIPPESEPHAPAPSLDPHEANDRYSELVELFSRPDSRQALVVIPDSSHLATDLEQLVCRMIEIEAVGGSVRCADVDSPDPLQDGLSRLALPGRKPDRQRRIRDAILSKAVRGEALGRLPFGYKAGADGMPAPVPGEAEIVAQVFDWYLGEPRGEPLGERQGERGSDDGELGDGSGGIGFRRIAGRLNERGITTRTGNRWSPVAISGMLRNRAYIGTYSRQGIRLVTNHPALVDRAVFNRAQEIVGGRQPNRRARKPSRFRLRGLLRCAQCGSGAQGVTRARRWSRLDGTEVNREYLYYECPARPARSDEPLNHAAWRAGDLEAAVMEELRKLAVTGDAAASSRDEFESSGPAQLNALEREFMRRYRMVANGHGRVQTLDSLVDEMSRARGGVGPNATEAAAGDADTVEPRPDRGELLRQAGGDDVEVARLALSAMISRLDVGATEIELTPRA